MRTGITFLLLLSILSPFAQVQDLKFTRLTEEDGLPSSHVYCFLEDDQGFMWIGTSSGLCRYDGYEIVPFTQDQGYNISHDNINALIQDSDGIIWIGTNAGGVNTFDPTTGKFNSYTYDPQNPTSIPGDRVRSLVEGEDDIIWIGFDNDIGLAKFNKKTGESINYDPFVNIPSKGVKAIRSMLIDVGDSNLLWLGTTRGLISFDIANEEFEYKIHPLEAINRHGLFALAQINESQLLGGFFHVGTDVYNINEERWDESYQDPSVPIRVYDLARKSSNEYWIAARKRGVATIDLTGNTLDYLPASLNNYETAFPGFTYTVYSNDEMIWAGSKHGVSFASLKPLRFSFDSLRFASDEFGVVTDFSGRYDKIYITGIDGGLWEVDKETGKKIAYRISSGAPELPYHIFEQKDRLVIINAGNELILFDKKSKQFEGADVGKKIDPYNYYDQIVEWNSEFALVPTRQAGTFKMNLKSLELTPLFEVGRNSDLLHHDVIVDDTGLIWMATKENVTIYDPQYDSIGFYAPSSLLSKKDKHVHVLEKLNGVIWIGTSNGLVRYKDGEERLFNTLNSDLASGFIRDITVDARQNLWVATLKGISKIDPISFEIRNFDKTDGVLSEGGLVAIDNSIFVGSYGGYTQLSIDSLFINVEAPTVRFAEFNVLNGDGNLPNSVSI